MSLKSRYAPRSSADCNRSRSSPQTISSHWQRYECSPLRLASPPDPLTRAVMDADGVTEAALDALMQRVADVLASRRR